MSAGERIISVLLNVFLDVSLNTEEILFHVCDSYRILDLIQPSKKLNNLLTLKYFLVLERNPALLYIYWVADKIHQLL